MIRWLFFPISVLIQFILIYPIYILMIPIFWFKHRGKVGNQLTLNGVTKKFQSLEDAIQKGRHDTLRDDIYLDDSDPHNSLMHMSIWSYFPGMAQRGLKELMYPNGSLRRKYPTEAVDGISGDCLSAWVFTHAMFDGDVNDLKLVADHYIKNCFGLQATNDGKTMVSDRCSNGGMNIVYDSPIYLSVPCFGPQYFTSAALLKYASFKLGGKYTFFYYLNYALFGGWLYHFMPVMYTKNHLMYYLQHITMLNLVTLSKLGVNTKFAARRIAIDLSPMGNVHPVLYSLAHLTGALRPEEVELAKDHLLHITHIWPQYPPLDQSFYDKDTVPDGDSSSKPMASLIGLCARILLDEV